MKVLVLDNYDSFTYNLVHMVEHITGTECDVFKNDEIDIESVKNYDKIILSPGPGIPDSAGVLKDVIKAFAPTHSMLGVCLGHQAIAEVFGCELINISKVYHGVATPIHVIKPYYLYDECPSSFLVGRYHSWAVKKESVNDQIIVTAVDDDQEVLSLKHSSFDVNGIQFHPESILSEYGKSIINNFLSH